jgi:hypothetical protein
MKNAQRLLRRLTAAFPKIGASLGLRTTIILIKFDQDYCFLKSRTGHKVRGEVKVIRVCSRNSMKNQGFF